MATFTQEKQPYGRLVRREYARDGFFYVIRLDGVYGDRERWGLYRRVDGPCSALEPEGHVFLPIGSALKDAQKRLYD